MISEVYSQLVFENILRERYLNRGASPGPDQMDSIMSQVAERRLGEEGSNITYAPQPNDESSAKEIQKTLETLAIEATTIFVGSALLKDRAKRVYDRAENQAALINKQAVDLALEACALAQGRQQGLNLFTWDSFIDMTKTDQTVTSLSMDVKGQSVRLKTQPNERRIDLSSLDDGNFTTLIFEGDVAGQSLAPESRFKNAVDDSDSYWLHRVSSSVNDAKGLALQIDMGSETVMNRVIFTPFGANTDSGIQVRVLASLNGLNWRELMPITQQTTPKVQIDGIAVKARYLRIEMTRSKPSYRTTDSSGFTYEFGINNLRVYESLNYPTGQFVSKPMEFRDVLGNLQRINRLKFNFYDERPPNTEIIYYIVTDPSSTEGLIKITPNEPITLNTVVEIKEAQGKIRSRYDSNHALIEFKLKQDFIPETVRLFRNTYQPNLLINGVQAGWTLDNSYYSCILELLADKEINLGVNFAYIDGKKINGIYTLTKGFHTFKTHETNWRVVNSETEDPLFPYNHKLIIEGLRGSTTYAGVDFLAAAELNLISAFDLIKNIPSTNNEYYGINGSYPIVKIPIPPVFLNEIEGWRLEQYAIRYKYISDTIAPITSVRLVARMSTSNPRLTPVLRGYIALAGF